jgi:hypothetical protein
MKLSNIKVRPAVLELFPANSIDAPQGFERVKKDPGQAAIGLSICCELVDKLICVGGLGTGACYVRTVINLRN